MLLCDIPRADIKGYRILQWWTWCSGPASGSGSIRDDHRWYYMERRGKNYWNPRQRQGLQGFFCYSHSRSLWPNCWVSGFKNRRRFFTPSFRIRGQQISRKLSTRAIRSIISQYLKISGLKTKTGDSSFVETHGYNFCAKRRKWFEPSSSPADGPAFKHQLDYGLCPRIWTDEKCCRAMHQKFSPCIKRLLFLRFFQYEHKEDVNLSDIDSAISLKPRIRAFWGAAKWCDEEYYCITTICGGAG